MLSGERGGLVRRTCCVLTAANLWARSAFLEGAGEGYFPAILQVRTEVLRLL